MFINTVTLCFICWYSLGLKVEVSVVCETMFHYTRTQYFMTDHSIFIQCMYCQVGCVITRGVLRFSLRVIRECEDLISC